MDGTRFAFRDGGDAGNHADEVAGLNCVRACDIEGENCSSNSAAFESQQSPPSQQEVFVVGPVIGDSNFGIGIQRFVDRKLLPDHLREVAV